MLRGLLLVVLCLGAATAAAQAPVDMAYVIYYPANPAQPPAKVLAQAIAASGGKIQVVEKLPATPGAPVVQAYLEDRAQERFKPPSLESLKYFGRGLGKQEAVELTRARKAFVMVFAHSGKYALPALREADRIALEVARRTSGILWDDETREAFSTAAWQERRIDGWDGAFPLVSNHTVIHSYRQGNGVRAITLGMKKFGQPDLVVNDFGWAVNRPVGNLINATSQLLVEGTRPAANMSLDFSQIRHKEARSIALSDQKDGAKGKAEITLRETKAEKGDPDNFLLEFVFDRYPGPDRHARQEVLLTTLFGSSDSITKVKHDDAILAASAAAKAKLPALRKRFLEGLPPGAYLSLKAPFETDDGGREWMWVEVSEWKGDRIEGYLRNEPRFIKALKAGQKVQVSQADVFDYILHHKDGSSEGNETGRLIAQSKQ